MPMEQQTATFVAGSVIGYIMVKKQFPLSTGV